MAPPSPPSRSRRGVLRAVFATAGRPLARRTLATWGAVGIAAAIVFAPFGLGAADVVHLLRGDVGARAALWAGWLALTAPAVTSAFDAPGTRTLRALRPPRGALHASLLGLVLAVHAPWGALFGRGGGVASGLVAVAIAAAIQCSVAAIGRRPWAALLAAPAAAIALLDPPALAALPVAAALAYASVRVAWASALERGAWTVRLVPRSPPVVALAAVYLLRLVRAARARLGTAALLTAAGGAAVALSLRNDPTPRPIHRALLVMTLPLTVAAAVLVAPVLETEARLLPAIRSTRTPRAVALVAALLAIAAPQIAFASSVGAAAGVLGGAPPDRLATALGAWVLPLAGAVLLWGRRHDRTRRRDPVLFVVGVLALAILASLAVAPW